MDSDADTVRYSRHIDTSDAAYTSTTSSSLNVGSIQHTSHHRRGSHRRVDQGMREKPAWALEWNVFSTRYGSRIVDWKGEWRTLEFLPSSSAAWRRRSRRDEQTVDDDSLSHNVAEMIDQLESSIASLSNPWITPEHLHGDDGGIASKQPHLLFQYKPYAEQERLRLSDEDIAACMEAVFGISSPEMWSTMGENSKGLRDAKDAGVVILIKLVIDMYLDNGPEAAFPLVMYMLQKPLNHNNDVDAQCAVFDFLMNLMVHGELLCADDDENEWNKTIASPFRTLVGNEKQAEAMKIAEWPDVSHKNGAPRDVDPRKEQYREWLRRLFCSLTFVLSSVVRDDEDDGGSEVWASVLSCMICFCSHDGYLVREYLREFPVEALQRMLSVSRHAFWPRKIQSLLATVLANLLYSSDMKANFLDFDKVEEFGGIHNVAKEYYYAPTVLSCQSLFCVLLDYTLHKRSGDKDRFGATWKFSIDETFEVEAIGFALLHMGAPQSLREYLLLPEMSIDTAINSSIANQIHKEIVSHLVKDTQDSIPLAFVEYCISSLKSVSSGTYGIPSDLENHVVSTCVAGIFGEAPSVHWKYLENSMVDDTARGKVIGRNWMVRLMLSSSDRAVEEAWVTRTNVVPPPVPIMPSESPKELFTFGDTIMSAFAKSKTKRLQRTAYQSFEGDDDVLTNFALAIRQVVGAIKFRASRNFVEEESNELQVKWGSGVVDIDRLCISTIERAFEWILQFSSAPMWSSAVALLSECLISTIIIRKLDIANKTHHTVGIMDHGGAEVTTFDDADYHADAVNDDIAEEDHDNTAAADQSVPSLHIPSPSVSNEPETLSPFSKIVPGGPKIAAAWRRLTTPNSKTRPASAESQEEPWSRPLSAGVLMMESTRAHTRADSIFKEPSSLENSFQLAGRKNSTCSAMSMHPQIRGWKSISEKVQLQKEMNARDRLKEATRMCNNISLFEQTIDPVESFISGIASCAVEILELVNPLLLKDIFDSMNLSGDQFHMIEPSSRQTAVQAGKPFWDSRLAIFILFIASYTMTEKNQYNHPIETKGYLHTLIRDPDVRVRQHACAFILKRFCDVDREGYIKATRTMVSRAQQANDARIMRDPEIQLNKIMEMRLFDLNSLYEAASAAG